VAPYLVQAVARLVSQPPTPGAGPQSVMVEVYSPNIRSVYLFLYPRHTNSPSRPLGVRVLSCPPL
jgi:hypothetical protein